MTDKTRTAINCIVSYYQKYKLSETKIISLLLLIREKRQDL